MIIIVDTNIVFSAILNSTSRIGKVLLNSGNHFQFYTCNFLKSELFNHRNKIQKLTGLSASETEELEDLVTTNIKFINERIIPAKTVLQSEKLIADIDPGDIPFLALTIQMKGRLWTGDKKLIEGLKAKSFYDCITTQEISKLLDKLES